MIARTVIAMVLALAREVAEIRPTAQRVRVLANVRAAFALMAFVAMPGVQNPAKRAVWQGRLERA